MHRPTLGAPALAWALVGMIGAATICGCEGPPPLSRAGVSVAVPRAWTPVAPTRWPVPGQPLAAWEGPGGSSLVTFTSLVIPDGDARQVLTSLTNRYENLPDLAVVARSVEAWDGRDAARVEAIAPGTGDGLAATGTGTPVPPNGRSLVPTRQVVVGFARPSDTLYFVWHAPEAGQAELHTQIEQTLRTLHLDWTSPQRSSY